MRAQLLLPHQQPQQQQPLQRHQQQQRQPQQQHLQLQAGPCPTGQSWPRLPLPWVQLLLPRQEGAGSSSPPALRLPPLLLLQLTMGQAGQTWSDEGLGRQCLRVL